MGRKGIAAWVAAGALSLALAGARAADAPSDATPCVGGVAAGFPCDDVDLESRFTNASLGGGSGNDVWGWTDPDTQREYALMGQTNGTAFVDITDPSHATFLGRLPTQSGNSTWRDIKTRGYYAFVVSEAVDHGMQVFDLRRLRGVSTPQTFTPDAVYSQFGRAHNIVIDVDSGYAFAVGSRQGVETCNAGLHMVDVRTPLVPAFAGCFGADGYTHDAQCVTYHGPDPDYAGREICFASNEDTVTIVDVTIKAAPVQVSRTPYAGSAYTHQGWLTEDGRYFLVDDELDEIDFGHNTRTYVFDVTDLDAPALHMVYTAPVASSDHNLYVRGQFAYLANYRSGLRILDLGRIDEQIITEVASFDTQPASNASGTSGAWSSYPWFASGVVIVSDISNGLFVLRPDLCVAPAAPLGLAAAAGGDNRIDLDWTPTAPGTTVEVLRSLDGCGGPQEQTAAGVTGSSWSDLDASGGVTYGYRIRAREDGAACASDASACVTASTSGACTAPPQFGGLLSAGSAGTAQCAVDLAWQPGAPRCDGPLAYTVERSPGPVFDPGAATLVASGVGASAYRDATAGFATTHAYRVRAVDVGNGASDANVVSLAAAAYGALADGTFATGAEPGDPPLEAPTTTAPARIDAGDPEAPTHVAWEVVSDQAASGQRSYWSQYGNGQCLALQTPPLEVTVGQNVQVSFATRYGIEAAWDGGVVQVSGDGGATWQTVTPVGGYPSAFNATSNDACGLPPNQPAFSGTNLAWTTHTIELGAIAGTLQVRWLFSTDGGVTAQGWWIDDVAVTHVQVPGPCTPQGDLILADGFED